jgi:cellobiose-specific phosphotransferase system component IIA
LQAHLFTEVICHAQYVQDSSVTTVTAAEAHTQQLTGLIHTQDHLITPIFIHPGVWKKQEQHDMP